MGTILKILAYLVLGVIIWGVLKALMQALFQTFPLLKWVLCAIVVIVSFCVWQHWWLSLILGFVALGIGINLSEGDGSNYSNVHKCPQCKSTNATFLQKIVGAVIADAVYNTLCIKTSTKQTILTNNPIISAYGTPYLFMYAHADIRM